MMLHGSFSLIVFSYGAIKTERVNFPCLFHNFCTLIPQAPVVGTEAFIYVELCSVEEIQFRWV